LGLQSGPSAVFRKGRPILLSPESIDVIDPAKQVNLFFEGQLFKPRVGSLLIPMQRLSRLAVCD